MYLDYYSYGVSQVLTMERPRDTTTADSFINSGICDMVTIIGASCVDSERSHLNRGEVNKTDKAMVKSISYYVDELYKRGSRREAALPSIIHILTNYREIEFVEENFATVMFRLLDSIKKGSAKEKDLAAHALGLFAMTVKCRTKASELYEESISVLSGAIKPDANNSRILQSLAIIGFFCGANSVETEKTMQIIWDSIHKATNSTKLGLADKINAWCFLLSALDGWRINYKQWRGAIPYFSSLLEDENETLHDVASEALALIYEFGAVKKFGSKTKVTKDESLDISSEKDVAVGEENVTSNESTLLKFDSSEFQKFKKENKTIGKQVVTLSTYSQRRQLNFLCDFLGSKGLEAHIRENQLVQDVFEVIGRAPRSVNLYVSEKEKRVKHYTVPVLQAPTDDNLLPFLSSKKKSVFKRLTMSSNSSKSKARSQLLHQKRKDADGQKMDYFLAED